MAGLLLGWGLPFLLHRLAGFGVLREGHGGYPELALTFEVEDDASGDALLNDLAALDVRATLLWRRASPLIQRALAAGHEVGGLGGLANLSTRVHVWRPERYDATTLARLRRAGLRALGWSVEGDVLRRVDPGAVVRLRRGDLGLVPELRARGYTFVTVSELRGLRTETWRGLLIRAWRRAVDDRFDRVGEVDVLTQRAKGLARLSLVAYDGPPLTWPEGTVRPGERVAELHVHSKRLVALAEISALSGLRAFRDSMNDVAAELQRNPKYANAEVVFARTLFTDVMKPLGFSVVPLASKLDERILTVGMNALRRLYGTRTDRRVIVPRIAWMTRKEFLRRYGPAAKLNRV